MGKASHYSVKTDLTAGHLRSILDYEPTTGVFVWKDGFRNKRRTSMSGQKAGHHSRIGYTLINIDRSIYFAHRLAYLWMTSDWPPSRIDHINRDKTDNRWCNLRAATPSQNGANRDAPPLNTSGYKGVSWAPWAKKWRAEIRCNGARFRLGYFDSPELADAAYRSAADLHFGEFAV